MKGIIGSGERIARRQLAKYSTLALTLLPINAEAQTLSALPPTPQSANQSTGAPIPESSGSPAPAASPSRSGGRSTPNEPDIVVTANKREQSVQSIPAAVTALSGAAMREQGINDVPDLQMRVPSLLACGSACNRDPVIGVIGV